MALTNATEADMKVIYGMTGFIAQHTFMSHPPIRKKLVKAMGSGTFMSVYSILSFGVFYPIYYWYKITRKQDSKIVPFIAKNAKLYKSIGLGLTAIAAFCVPYSFGSLLGGSFGAKNAAAGSIEKRKKWAHNEKSIDGYKRISRHTEFCYFFSFCLGQFLNNGTYSYAYFYLPLCLECIIGIIHQDIRHKEWFGDDAVWFQKTSAVPFVAILQGKQSLSDAVNEIGIFRIGLGSVLGYLAYRYWK